MRTLIELKDWIKQGERVRRKDWLPEEYIFMDEKTGFFFDEMDRKTSILAEQYLANDWEKVGEKPIRWKPRAGEQFYFVAKDCTVYGYSWGDYAIDRRTRNSYNCFKTMEEAEQARDLWLAERELRSLADDGNYYITYNESKFEVGSFSFIRFSPYYFSTEEKAQQAIKQLGEEKLKLIFGVK